MKKLVQIAGEPASVGIAGMTNDVRRDVAIHAFHRAYALTKKTDYLDIGVHYVISPADNPNVCLGVWGTTGLLSGTEIDYAIKKTIRSRYSICISPTDLTFSITTIPTKD